MIDRAGLVGTWPDQRLCLALAAACGLLAALLALVAVRTWLKGADGE